MKVLVKVTREVQVQAMYCTTNRGASCEVAIAIREILPNAWVGQCVIFEDITCKGEICDLPNEASRRIVQFDNSTPSQRLQRKPFSFEIELPESVIQSIGIGEVYRVLSESRTLELVMPVEDPHLFI